jgi:hypothetical protein
MWSYPSTFRIRPAALTGPASTGTPRMLLNKFVD